MGLRRKGDIYRFVPRERHFLVAAVARADLAAVAEPRHAAHREAGDEAGELGRRADVRAPVTRADRHDHWGCSWGTKRDSAKDDG